MVRWAFRVLGLLALVLSTGFLAFANIAFAPPTRTPQADGIVALTGGGARIDEAMRLLSEKRADRMLITGVNPRTTRATLERLNPDYAPLFACCIDIGYWAQDTIGNADETEVWTRQHGFRRLIVVTSGYHMARSLAELARTMPDVDLIPHPVLNGSQRAEAWWRSPAQTRLLVVEYFKLLPALARLGVARAFGGDVTSATAAAAPAETLQRNAAVD